jgi:predicted phosphodiesterase
VVGRDAARLARWGGPLLAVALGGVAAAEPPAQSGAFQKGPYLQNVTPRSITIVWESSTPLAGEVRVPAAGKVVRVGADELHEVVIDGLEPGRRYLYEVVVDGVTERGELATAALPGAPFTFVVYGDSRENVAAHERVVERVRGEVPDFLIGTGDMVNEGAVDQQWQRFFEVERELLRDNVLYPSLGNHDRQGRGRTADNYRRYFSLPENSSDPERYYAFTYGGGRFLVLDSNAYSFALTDQTVWIEQQLQAARLDPDIKHIFVSMHHPPYSVSLHGGQSELREAWTPLFEKYGVAAVFSGHDHVYSRAEKNGVHYFISGGAGAPLYPRKSSAARIDVEATKYFERVNHHLRVSVVGDLIEVSAIRADGTRMETLSWGEAPQPLARGAAPGGKLAAVGATRAPGAPARTGRRRSAARRPRAAGTSVCSARSA